MPKAKGWKSRLAIGRESTYAEAVAVTRAIPFLTEGIKHNKERSYDESLVGNADFKRSFVGQETDSGPLPCYLDYGNIDMLIAAALGAAGTPVLVTDLYENTYSLSDELDISLTAAINKAVSIHEWRGIKINKLAFKGVIHKPVTCDLEVVAFDRKITGTTNDAAAIAAATILDVPLCMFEDLTFRIANLADALVSGDNLLINSFEFSIDNKLKTDDITNGGLDEPERDGRRLITLNVGLPSYQTDDYINYHDTNTELQVLMQFSRSAPGLTDDYAIELRLGKLQVGDFPTPIEGEGMVKPPLSLVAYAADTDNPTWPTMEGALEISVINPQSTSPLA